MLWSDAIYNTTIRYSYIMNKIKIAWLTGHSFIDVDKPLVPTLSKVFDIQWIVIRNQGCWYSIEEVEEIMASNGIKGKIFTFPGRMRSLGCANIYRKVINLMKEFDADLYYINYIGIPYLWPFLLVSSIPTNRIVYPCHDFEDHVGVQNRAYYVITKRLIFNTIKNFQFFSKSQQHLFEKKHKGKNIYYAPLALKSFGNSTEIVNRHKITFLFFGSIRPNKGLEFLIEAANKVYEKHAGKFEVKIAGGTSDWDYYNALIKYPECFTLDIRRVRNEEIPNLYANADFLVLPYRDVTQSGPLMISYNYNLPVIASNHDGFKEYIEHGYNGFLFKNENSDNLANVMSEIIEGKYDIHAIKNHLKEFVDTECSIESICMKYEEGFSLILQRLGNE